MKRRHLILPLLIFFILLVLWPISAPAPRAERHEGYTLKTYAFATVDEIKISGGIIVRSGGNAYLIRNESVKGYHIGSERIMGSVGGYLVTHSNYKIHIKRPNGIIFNDKWSKSLKLRNSVAVGENFVVTAEHDDRKLKVNILFYFPKSGKTREYSFQSDRKGTLPKVAAGGKYAIVGVPYT